ncbi:methyltransferase [Geobacillus subterraneus]|uniref:N(4)-bis(aminopropyl)spermidine synthase n=2 Tax=Geobacillus TaxID=129337 RepID=A0ABM6ADF8_9BACL|nr:MULTISPECIES: bis-aminopropyl spermidine synthase family protein [Geobacillus]AMX84397.1 methyltransferase [Geobacillus subterraneus]KZS25205.1 methyltransferase [Geobacillus subterraneus]OXB87687.1 putative methyltransferase [Geobacillus uzenensis]
MSTIGIAAENRRIDALLLRALYFGPKSYWELMRAAQAQTHQVLKALQSLLEGELVVYDGDRFVITEAGRQQAETLSLERVAEQRCEACAGRGIVLRPPFDSVLAAFQDIAAMRPKATPDFDQGYVTPETTVRRLALMAQQGDLMGRDILLLGDDDLTSIAAALSGLPRRICVLDVDERIITFIRDVARDRGWDHVHAEVYDVRDELPSHLRGQFDVFFTDPVDTVKGLLLFLSRCTEGLRGPGAAGYFGLSYLEASWRKWRQIQQGILDMGYAITDMLGAFQDYLLEDIVALDWARMAPVPVKEPDIPFYVSTVYRLELVEEPQPLFFGRVELGQDLYYDEEFCVPLQE